MPVGIVLPVWGHLIMIMPILLLPCSVLSAFPFAARGTAPLLLGGGARSSRSGGLQKRQDAFCSTLLKLCLIGSAVAVATCWVISQSSRFCTNAASKALRLCVADRLTTSDIERMSMRRATKSKAKLVLAFDISMTLAP